MFWLANIINGSYTQHDLPRIEAWVNRERSKAVHGLFSILARGAVRAVRAAGHGVNEAYAGLADLGEKLSLYRRKRVAIRELNALSDRTLKDIGLHRAEIHAAVEEALNGERRAHVPVRSATVHRVEEHAETESSIGEPKAANDWQRAA